MTTAVANSIDPFGGTQHKDQSLRQFLIYSVIMHACLAVVVVVSAYIQYRGSPWGGIGGDLGGTKVSLVSSAGIPMPKESVVTESKAVDPTKGLHKEEPVKPPEPKTDATKIPKFEKEKRLPPTARVEILICRLDNRRPPGSVRRAAPSRAKAARTSPRVTVGTSQQQSAAWLPIGIRFSSIPLCAALGRSTVSSLLRSFETAL